MKNGSDGKHSNITLQNSDNFVLLWTTKIRIMHWNLYILKKIVQYMNKTFIASYNHGLEVRKTLAIQFAT